MTDTNKTIHDHERNERSRRRMLYGSNLVILVIFAIALVVILNYAAQFRSDDSKIRPVRFDWSTAGANSLSPATIKLLGDLDKKGDSFELASLFGLSSGGSSLDVEQYRQVEDVLNEYARRSTHIKIYQPRGVRDELEQKVAERYKDETDKYAQTLQAFAEKAGAGKPAGLAEQMEAFLKGQAPAFVQLAAANRNDADTVEFAGAFNVAFSTDIPSQISKIRKNIDKTADSVLPDWSGPKTELSTFLGSFAKKFEQMADPAKLEGLPKPLVEYFKKNNAAYKEIVAAVKAYQEKLDKLPELQIDAIKRDIDRNSILVFGPKSVKVISKYDIFKAVPDRSGGREAFTFEGEQAISSALLAMVRPDKPKVVFVSGSSQQRLTTGQFSDVADQLRKNNFEVLEWAPPGPQMSPDQPPPELTPPAQGKGVVWVVFPPEAPMMPGMPSANGPLVAAVKEHMDKGGSALFLAEAANPMMAFGGPDASGFAFADIVKPFGITVKPEYTVITQRATQRGVESMPMIMFTHYPKHPITSPLESLQTMFYFNQTRFGFSGAPTVVEADKANPAASVILQTDRSNEIFATKSMPGRDTKFDASSDIASPVPVAAASSKNDGDKDKQQRVVVIGNRFFALNDLIEAVGAVTDEDKNIRAVVPLFPGNSELFCNSIYWLSGYENMIAVSAKANVAQRIAPMSDTTLLLIRLLVLWIGLPIGALVLGGVVYFMRHR